MSPLKRTDRLNSLLKEVLSEVIRKDVKNPHIHDLFTITQVDISSDLSSAKVLVSVIANQQEKETTLRALQSAAGFIAVNASKKVTLRHFPQLIFKLDNSAEKHLQIDQILAKINLEKKGADDLSTP